MSYKERGRLSLNSSPADLLFVMSEGNPGAITAIMTMLERLKEEHSGDVEKTTVALITLLLNLDDMNIRGEQIHVLYKYVYDFDVKKAIQGITTRSKEMVGKINEEMLRYPVEGMPIAVERGASFGERLKYQTEGSAT